MQRSILLPPLATVAASWLREAGPLNYIERSFVFPFFLSVLLKNNTLLIRCR